MKIIRQLFLALSLVSLALSLKAETKQNVWSSAIVPTRSSAQTGNSIESAGFYVVLTNISDSDLSVWREWCSWGHDALSFVITQADGRSFKVKKTPGAWTKNYPDSFLVRKGSHFVYSVCFDNEWAGFPENWKNGKVKMKAIFKINPDEYSASMQVWTGTAESPEIEVNLYRQLPNKVPSPPPAAVKDKI